MVSFLKAHDSVILGDSLIFPPFLIAYTIHWPLTDAFITLLFLMNSSFVVMRLLNSDAVLSVHNVGSFISDCTEERFLTVSWLGKTSPGNIEYIFRR